MKKVFLGKLCATIISEMFSGKYCLMLETFRQDANKGKYSPAVSVLAAGQLGRSEATT